MCRLFGFRSHKSLPVHHSLIAADNALAVQSQHHPDGWGVAYFNEEQPFLHKGTSPAFRDEGFRALCRSLSSHTVIAHVRQATVGQVHLSNTHPFQHEQWVFAHNGTVYGFSILRPYFIEEISPDLRRHIGGATDSEHCFYLFLSELEARADLNEATIADVEDALCACLQKIASWCRLVGIRQAPCMNFMVSNGRLFATTRLGRDLFFSTRSGPVSSIARAGASELPRDTALNIHSLVERRSGSPVTHVLVASEVISTDDDWEEVPNNAILLVDEQLRFSIRRDIADLDNLEFEPMPASIHHTGIAS